MAEVSDGEVEHEYLESMGSELGSLFAELSHELTYLNIVWVEYLAVFGSGSQKLALANQAAHSFFFVVEKSLREGVFLHLARMSDPPKSMGRSNLTVTALGDLVRPDLGAEVRRLVDRALNATAFARDWRNRYIAHKDLPLALGDEKASPLQAASRATVGTALRTLDELLNFIAYSYTGSVTAFSAVLPSNSGADRLLDVLQKGLLAEEAEELEFKRKWSLP